MGTAVKKQRRESQRKEKSIVGSVIESYEATIGKELIKAVTHIEGPDFPTEAIAEYGGRFIDEHKRTVFTWKGEPILVFSLPEQHEHQVGIGVERLYLPEETLH